MTNAKDILENDVEWLRCDRDSWKAMAHLVQKESDQWKQAYLDMKEIAQSAIRSINP